MSYLENMPDLSLKDKSSLKAKLLTVLNHKTLSQELKLNMNNKYYSLMNNSSKFNQ